MFLNYLVYIIEMFFSIEKDKKIIVLVVFLALLIFLVYASLPFLSAFFGAAILAYIFMPLHKKLTGYFSNRISALFVILIALVLIVFPIIFIIDGLIEQIYLLPNQIEKLRDFNDQLNEKLNLNIAIDADSITRYTLTFVSSYIRPFVFNIIHLFIILFLLFFLLYYFLVDSEKIYRFIKLNLPFSENINKEIILRFEQLTNATILGTFFVGIFQGILLALSFLVLGIPNALFWGFLGGLLAFIPLLGTPIIWVPAVIILFLSGVVTKGIILLIFGIIISSSDNVLRPLFNRRYGKIHPAISIIGIFTGIPIFGIIGIFIGPLLVVYLVLFWEIYTEKYGKLK